MNNFAKREEEKEERKEDKEKQASKSTHMKMALARLYRRESQDEEKLSKSSEDTGKTRSGALRVVWL